MNDEVKKVCENSAAAFEAAVRKCGGKFPKTRVAAFKDGFQTAIRLIEGNYLIVERIHWDGRVGTPREVTQVVKRSDHSGA